MLSFFSCFKIEIKPLSCKPIFLKKKKLFFEKYFEKSEKGHLFLSKSRNPGKVSNIFFFAFLNKNTNIYIFV